MNKPAIRPLVWVVAAVAVTATATALITASLITDNSVLTPEAVDRALAGGTNTPAATATSPGPASTTGTAADLTSTLTPGVVTVHCDGAAATLVSWSPNPGWRADDPVRGPAAEVSVKFESDIASDFMVTATCAGGVPVVNVAEEFDDHGGRRGGDDDDRGSDDDY